MIGAKYSISTVNTTNNTKTVQYFILWRYGEVVAHEYPAANITEIWERSKNGMLRLVRNFDVYKRSIEYSPYDINNGKGDKDWKLKYQLISDTLKNALKLNHTTGHGCKITDHLMQNKDDVQIKLEWMPKQQLIKSLEVNKQDKNIHWQLENTITKADVIKSVFLSRTDYHATDYIDIGDNESDPFLLKMINLGFVEHGSSGFYDADGHAIENRHQHKH